MLLFDRASVLSWTGPVLAKNGSLAIHLSRIPEIEADPVSRAEQQCRRLVTAEQGAQSGLDRLLTGDNFDFPWTVLLN